MASGGDILVVQKDSERPFAADTDLEGTTGGTVTLAAARTNFQIYVQKIVLSIVTHVNAKIVTFQDSTPLQLAAHTDATAAAGVPSVVAWDFGPHGAPLAVDKAFTVTNPASGCVGRVHVEGYYKPGRTLNTGMVNSQL
jgi:hypothetical protein